MKNGSAWVYSTYKKEINPKKQEPPIFNKIIA